MTESDQTLVRRAQQGDRPAFEEIVRRTSRLLYSRLFLDHPRPDQAEDLVQETYLLAWRSIGQVTDPDGFRAWLLSLAKSVSIDAVRRQKRKKRWGFRAPIEAAGEVADASDGPADSAERAEAREKAIMLLRSLPDSYRLPLTLRYIGGADYDMIGRQLGLSNGSLRGLLNRGLARLREQMREPDRSAEPRRLRISAEDAPPASTSLPAASE